MKPLYELKIDAYAHIIPPKYKEALRKVIPDLYDRQIAPYPSLFDLDARFRIMDKYEPLRQVLTLGRIPVEHVAGPEQAADLAKMADDEMAELVAKYPDRFVAALATLPMNNMDFALREADRAIKELRFKGVYIHTPVDEKPLDLPEFLPLYEKMVEYDLPIVIHPMRKPNHPDYLTEKLSKYNMFSIFGWPYDTTSAMARLVFSGIMEKYPNLKIVVHHLGGMIPFYAERIRQFTQVRRPGEEGLNLKKDAIDYFKMFYADTATYGNTECPDVRLRISSALTTYCLGLTSHWVTPKKVTGTTARPSTPLKKWIYPNADKKKIYEDNARQLMRLPI